MSNSGLMDSSFPETRLAGTPAALRLPGLPPSANAEGTSRPPFTLRELVTGMFLRRRLVVAAFLLPLLAGAIAAFLAGWQSTAESLLIVLPNLRSAGATDVAGYGPSVVPLDPSKASRSEIDIIQSQNVVEHALQRLEPDTASGALMQRLLFFMPQPTPEEKLSAANVRFRRTIHVWGDSNSNILWVTLTASSPARAITSLSVLIDAYLEQRRSIFRSTNSQFLSDELGRYTEQLQQLEQQIQAMKANYRVLDPAEEIRISSERLNTLTQRKDQLSEQRVAALAQLDTARHGLATLPPRVLAAREVTNQAMNDDSRNALLRLQVERAHTATQYTPSAPQLKELDQKIVAVRAGIEANRSTNVTTSREVRNPSVELLNSRLVTAEMDAAALDRQLQELESTRQRAEERAIQVLVTDARLRPLLRQRDALEGVYRQFATREAAARMEEKADEARSSNVHVVQQPTLLPGQGMALALVVGGLAAGVVAAATIVLAFAALRRVPIHATEAENSLGIRLLANFPAGQRFLATTGCPAAAGLAALLVDTASNETLSVVQFVPPDGEDCAELVHAVAVELARDFGRRTLLVDLAGASRRHLEVLGNDAERAEPVVGETMAFSTGIRRLWVAYDARAAALAEVHAGAKEIKEALDRFRAGFEMILIIAPVGQDDYASRRLSALVDSNVLVIRAEHTRTDQTLCSRQRIVTAGGNLLGFAFTGQRQVLPPVLERLL